ncbi:MAG: hypothetical protein R6U26_01445 [Candidatus Undinarchaeales archaeon]
MNKQNPENKVYNLRKQLSEAVGSEDWKDIKDICNSLNNAIGDLGIEGKAKNLLVKYLKDLKDGAKSQDKRKCVTNFYLFNANLVEYNIVEGLVH